MQVLEGRVVSCLPSAVALLKRRTTALQRSQRQLAVQTRMSVAEVVSCRPAICMLARKARSLNKELAAWLPQPAHVQPFACCSSAAGMLQVMEATSLPLLLAAAVQLKPGLCQYWAPAARTSLWQQATRVAAAPAQELGAGH